MIPTNNSYYSSTSNTHCSSHRRPRVRNDRLGAGGETPLSETRRRGIRRAVVRSPGVAVAPHARARPPPPRHHSPSHFRPILWSSRLHCRRFTQRRVSLPRQARTLGQQHAQPRRQCSACAAAHCCCGSRHHALQVGHGHVHCGSRGCHRRPQR